MDAFAWIEWNPPGVLFEVPFFQHPIRWYGVFFAIGFACGYFLWKRLFYMTLLKHAGPLQEEEIQEWRTLIEILQSRPDFKEFLKKLSPKAQEALAACQGGKDPSPSLRGQLLKILRGEDFSSFLDPSTQEKIQSFVLRQALSKKVKQRLALEALFQPALRPLQRAATLFADRILWFVILGTILGARLGHVLFYDWEQYAQNPLDILKTWEGGLASHGGAVGVLIALFFFYRSLHKSYPKVSFFALLDTLVIPTALAAFWIRMGNFFNQEILGTLTQRPWGVVFLNPWDGSLPEPRHAVQLYEALGYLAFFFLLWILQKRHLPEGRISALFFLLVFSFRFGVEFFKAPQEGDPTGGFLLMGQILSIPFVFLGLWMLWKSAGNSKH